MFCGPVAQSPVSHVDTMNTSKELIFFLAMSATSSPLVFQPPTLHMYGCHTPDSSFSVHSSLHVTHKYTQDSLSPSQSTCISALK